MSYPVLSNRYRSRFFPPLPLAILLCLAPVMFGASDPQKPFDLPAGAAEKSLRLFSTQSGVQVIFPTEVTAGIRTPAVHGMFGVRDALDRLLSGTGLVAVHDPKTAAITVQRSNDTPPRKNPAATGDSRGATGSIEGRVENAITGVYLNNARVSIDGTKLETLTNAQGEFRFNSVPAGQVRLHASYTGLEEKSVEVAVQSNATAHQKIGLASRGHAFVEGEATKLDPFIVAAEREKNAQEMAVNERRHAANVKNVVSGDQFGDISDGNVGEFLKYLPGVSVGYSAWDPNTVSLRGMPSSTTVVTLDGSAISSVSSGNDRTMTLFGLSMNNVSRIEVTKSPTPDLPANALGGSVNLIPASAFDRRTPQTTYRAYTNFNMSNGTFSKVPAPDSYLTMRGFQPGLDFKSIMPVNERFGFTLTGLYTRRYDQNDSSNPNWVGVSSAGAGIGASR